MVGDFHCKIDNTTRMCHELSSGHKLVFGIFSERVAGSAVPSGKATAVLNGFQQYFFLCLRYFAH